MSLVTKIIETELAPLIDIHTPGVAEVLQKLVREAQTEATHRAINQAVLYVEKSYIMDESGTEPLEPYIISQRLREDLPRLCGLTEITPETTERFSLAQIEIDSLLDL